jgi:flagellar hook-associated protein 3 FlgL
MAQARHLEAQRRVVTGKKLEVMADDPFNGGIVLRMSAVRQASDQYRSNLQTAKGWLGFSESALGDIGGIMTQAYQRAIQAANGITDQAAREGMAREVEDMQRRLVDLANSKGPGGQYLFAGQRTETKPYTITLTTLAYNGDDKQIVVETGPGETQVINTPGGALFLDAYAALESLKTHLRGGDISAISGVDLQQLKTSMNQLATARGDAGFRLQHVTDLDGQHARRIDELTAGISNLEDVDLAKAATDLQLAATAYQAALQVAARGFSLSLMDFLT